MLSPYATSLILKHFNAVDEAVSEKLLRSRIRNEEEMTKSLIDALDEKYQRLEGVNYLVEDLRKDLNIAGESTLIELDIETHIYSKQFEAYVSQADLGLVIQYKNHYEPRLSKSWSWLLQAKRVFPVNDTPIEYSADSRFKSFDKDQHEQIQKLVEYVGVDFFRYILYCPRPKSLGDETRKDLNYLRGVALQDMIFDFTYGLELRDDLRNGSPTVEAGIFISQIDPFPSNLGDVHRKVFHKTIPFSWFLLEHFSGNEYLYLDEDESWPRNQDHEFVQALVRGDAEAVREILATFDLPEQELRILPPATITVTISHGSQNTRALD